MSVQGFNSDKCAQRSRIAAARFGVDAAPLRFRGSSPSALRDDFLTLKSDGAMPATPEAALAIINTKLPDGAAPLALDDIYLQFHEAANSNFIGCRSMYLDETTLRNIAQGGNDGVSFMNAHRTGGLSTPSELPFGQTFCGFYEEGFDANGNAARRATLGVYLLRGTKPNGDNGPTTDDLDKGFRAGTVKDVSVGLSGGDDQCDVCGHGLDAVGVDENGSSYLMCPHVPGTHRGMSQEQIAAQIQRDPLNVKGVATYSLCGAHLNELSAVYDGAVPGAGVRKVMSLSKMNADTTTLQRDDVRAMLRQAYDYYGALLPFDLGEIVEIKGAETHSATTHSAETRAGKVLKNQPAPKMALSNGDNMSLLQKIATALGIPSDEAETSDEATPNEATPNGDAPNAEPPKAEPTKAEPTTESATERESADLSKNAQKLQAQLDAANAKLAANRVLELQAARDKFAVSLEKKVAPVAREGFVSLFAKLQNDGHSTVELESAIAALPKFALLRGIEADVDASDSDTTKLSEVAPPQTREEQVAQAAFKAGQEFAAATNPKAPAKK